MSIQGNWDRTTLTRRRLLGWAGLGAGGLAIAASGASPRSALAKPFFADDPFSLGVASGDPLPDGVVLWTRLAPDPLAPDGSGGLAPETYGVRFEVAEDEGFSRVVRRGAVEAGPELAHSVHVEVQGLGPGREYFYRFKAGPEISPVGRTKTAPAFGAANGMAFAFASCQNYPAGYYTAYGHMADEDLDLVVQLGDYIYQGPSQGSIGRPHAPAREATSLADYRIRTAQYKTDPDLRAVHARHPFAVTWDDHEVDNNYADENGDLPPGRRSSNGGRRPTRPTSSISRCGPLRSPRGPTCASTAASPTATWPSSACWTPASTATRRPTARIPTSATARSGSTPPARCSARSRSAGCSTD
jgi:alkaline phosphatase D